MPFIRFLYSIDEPPSILHVSITSVPLFCRTLASNSFLVVSFACCDARFADVVAWFQLVTLLEQSCHGKLVPETAL